MEKGTASSGEGNHRPEIDMAIKDLLQGREMAARLYNLLQEPTSPGSRPAAGDLVDAILGTFYRVVSALDAATDTPYGDDPCLAAAYGAGSLCLEDRKSKISARGKRKACSRTHGGGGGGGYRRRLRSTSSRTIVAKSSDDGQAWRKYGQKFILNSKHPRSYFRCTHKHEQGCMAQRQVQKSENDTSTYLITYIGEHTCILDPSTITPLPPANETSSLAGSCLISFESSNTTSTHIGQEAPLNSSLHSLKQEGEEEVLNSQILAGQLVAGAPAPETAKNLELGYVDFLEGSFELEDLVFDFGN